ncbi:hypothetical protein BH09BAC1_BH09BAC1_05220 [soil metagenome]
MFRHLLIILLCLYAITAMAQVPKLVALNGKVLDAADSMGAPYVHIWGLQSRVGGSTNVDGTFSILVLPGDTLRLSSVGYLTKVWVVPYNIAQLAPPTIMLYREMYNIDEVTVMPSQGMPRAPQTTPPSRPMPLDNTPMFGVGQNGGITFGFDTKAAHMRQQQTQINEWEYQRAMEDYVAFRYNKDFIQQFVPLADYQINPFMDYCRIPAEFIVQSNDYDLAKAIKDCYKAFIRQ